MRGILARIAAVAVVLVAPSVASADVTRVAVDDGDPNFVEALTTTLEAWQIEVVAVSEPDGINLVTAHRVAVDAVVGAVVWVSAMGGDHVLWVYDARDERVVARRIVAPPPFDEPTAASVALSVKTLLRHSAVAPTTERFGASAPKDSPFVFDKPKKVEPPPTVVVEVTGGARFRSVGASNVEPTFGVGVFWSPAALSGRYGAILGVRAGPGVALDTAQLIGTYRDTAVYLGLCARLPLRGRFGLSWALAADAHYTQLDGLVTAVDQTASESRLNPALRGHLGLRVQLGYAALELGGDAERWLRGQRYTVFGEPVLETPTTVYSILATLALPFR